MRANNPADRRRAARLGIPLAEPIYASLEHHVREPPTGVQKLPATLVSIEIPEQLKFAAGAPGWAALNPSVAVWNGELWCVVRLWEGWSGGKTAPRTVNVLGRLGPDWRPRPMKTPEGEHYEDLRLFVRGDRLAACGTTTDNRPLHGIAVLDLSPAGDIVKGHSVPSPRIEKNWMPVVDNFAADGPQFRPGVDRDQLRFIYSVDPQLQVLEYRGSAGTSVEELTACAGYLRGSSQLAPYEDGWIAVVHERWHVLGGEDRRYYLHRFVRFDRALTTVKIGETFYFRDPGIEFCAGLAHWQGKWVLSFGYKDKEAMLAHVTDATMKTMVPA